MVGISSGTTVAILIQVNDSSGSAVINLAYVEFWPGDSRDPYLDRIFHTWRRHCRAADTTSKCSIARSCPARTGAVGTDVGATTVYRPVTDLHFSEAWRDTPAHDGSAWTASIASTRS